MKMNFKKIFLISLILLCLSLSAVSATDLNDTKIIETSSASIDIHNSNFDIEHPNIHALDELQTMINKAEAGSVIDLNVDYDDVNNNGIKINKDITIDGHGHTIDGLSQSGSSIITSEKGNIILKNLKIVNGYNDKNDKGGAIFIEGSATYTLEKCIITNNWANHYGGAIYNDAEKTLTIKDCYFKSNTADYDDGGAIFSKGAVNIEESDFDYNKAHDKGGAIYCLANVNLIDTSFRYNKAMGGKSVDCYGGAIFSSGTVTVKRSNFEENYAEDYGGAIYAEGSVNINQGDNTYDFNSYITNNYVSDDKGGAIYAEGDVKISNAVINGNHAKVDGGAICTKGNVNLKHCDLNSNYAKGANSQCYGGAIRAKDATIENSTFNKNYAKDYGGAIYCNALKITDKAGVSNSYFTNNEANDDKGGAVYAEDDVEVNNAIFSSNKAKVDGGAIFCSKKVTVKESLFNKNKAEGAKSKCLGGAIKAKTAVIDNSRFADNIAENHGGAIYAETTTLSNRNYFTGNTATKGQGGAIYTNKFDKDIKYATFASNNAGVTSNDDGGAIYINSKNEITFSNCIFINNKCSDEGGAIYLDSSSSKLNLKNNFFYGNTAKDGQNAYTCGNYNTIEKNWWAGSNPSSTNDKLIEWKSVGSNIHHSDNNFLISILQVNIVKSAIDMESYITVQQQFYTANGESIEEDIFDLSQISINATPDAKITKKEITNHGIFAEFKPDHDGTYTITIDYYGYKLTKTIDFKNETAQNIYI